MRISINIDLDRVYGDDDSYSKSKIERLQQAISILNNEQEHKKNMYEKQREEMQQKMPIPSHIDRKTGGHISCIKQIINDLESSHKPIPMEDVIKEAVNKNIDDDEVMDIIDKLKRSGNIYEPRLGFIQKI